MSWSYFLDSDWPGKQTPTTRVYVPQRQRQKNREGLLGTDGKSSKLKQRLNKEKTNKEKTRKNKKNKNKTKQTKQKQTNKTKQTNKQENKKKTSKNK